DRDAYEALLRAHGLEPPEIPKEGALIAAEGELRPVVPMVFGPHEVAKGASILSPAMIGQAIQDPAINAAVQDYVIRMVNEMLAKERSSASSGAERGTST